MAIAGGARPLNQPVDADTTKSGALRIGIDVGTAFIKAVVASPSFEIVAKARAATPWTNERRQVTNPTEFQRVVHEVVAQALHDAGLDDAPTGTVASIGIVSMGESGVAVAPSGEAVWPAVPWHDGLGQGLEPALRSRFPRFARNTGRAPSALCSIVKWRSLRETYGDAYRWHAMAEWIARGFGVTPLSEGSLLSRTGALDVAHHRVNADALAWAGVNHDFVSSPQAAGSSEGRATIGPKAIRGATVAVAGLDCYAAAFAADVVQPGAVFLSCGTSGAAIRVLPLGATVDFGAAVEHGLTVDYWLDGERLVLLGASPCGLVLDPLRASVGPPGAPGTDDQWADAFASVADGQRDVLDALVAIGGPVDRYVGAGGWLHFDGLVQAINARVRPIDVCAEYELGAIGAARIAAQRSS